MCHVCREECQPGIGGFRSRTRTGKRPGALRSPHSLPTLRLVAPQGISLGLLLRPCMEHLRYRRSLSRVPAPMDFYAVSLLPVLVTPFGLVYQVTTSFCPKGALNVSAVPDGKGLVLRVG